MMTFRSGNMLSYQRGLNRDDRDDKTNPYVCLVYSASMDMHVCYILYGNNNMRMSVDPGVNGTGLAHWDERQWNLCLPPTKVLNIYPSKLGDGWLYRAKDLAGQFRLHVKKWRPTHVYFEMPEYMGGSAVGYTAAARGDLVKLTMILGMFTESCLSVEFPAEVAFFDVREWKGQLNKGIVQRRIVELTPGVMKLNPKSHSWDSIGIGLHAKGFKL